MERYSTFDEGAIVGLGIIDDEEDEEKDEELEEDDDRVV